MTPLPLVQSCAPIARPTLGETQARDLEQLFKALADRHRVRILNLLLQAPDGVCVCDFVPSLGLAQPTVSYHLRRLLDAGLLTREQRGGYAYFRAVPGALAAVAELLGSGGDA